MKKTLIHRSASSGDFTCIPNALLRNKTLSNGARGLIVAILSNAEDWQVNSAYIKRICTDGTSRRTSQLQELERHGYAVCQVLRNEWGTIKGQEWHFYDKPVPEKERSSPVDRGGKRIRTFKGIDKDTPSQRAASRHFQNTIGTQKTIRESKGLGKPSGKPVKKLLRAKIQEPERKTIPPRIHPAFEPPTSNELWEFVESNDLRTISKVRKTIYEELTLNNWHLWKKEQHWERVVNWRNMLIGLDRHLYETHGEKLPDLPATERQAYCANVCVAMEYEQTDIES